MIEMNNFRGDLTNISAKKEALADTTGIPTLRSGAHCERIDPQCPICGQVNFKSHTGHRP